MHLVPWIAAGGAVGAVARFVIGVVAAQTLGAKLPWGTLAVNVLGSFVLGLLVAASERAAWPDGVRVLVTTGAMGALTTFSTFSVETIRLLERGDVGWALANVLANVVLSLLAAAAGLRVLGVWPTTTG